MLTELYARASEVDAAHRDAACRATMRRKKLWGSAYALRATDVPHMTDDQVEFLTELAYLCILPAYRHIPIAVYETSEMSAPYRIYFTRLVRLACKMDTHGLSDLATDEDWSAWAESL